MNNLLSLIGGGSGVIAGGGALILVGHGLIFGGRKAVHWSNSALNQPANPYKKLTVKVGGYSLITLGVVGRIAGAATIGFGISTLASLKGNLGRIAGACAALAVLYSLRRHTNANYYQTLRGDSIRGVKPPKCENDGGLPGDSLGCIPGL